MTAATSARIQRISFHEAEHASLAENKLPLKIALETYIRQIVFEHYFRVSDHPEVGRTTQYKRVCRY